MILFAVVGGGIFAYKSFAATSGSKFYSYADYRGGFNGVCGMTDIIDTASTNKKNVSVLKMSPTTGPSASWCGSIPYSSQTEGIGTWASYVPLNMRLCILARGAAGSGDNTQIYISNSFLKTLQGPEVANISFKPVIKGSNAYQKVCSGTKYVPAGSFVVSRFISNSSPTKDLFFAGAYLEYTTTQ